MASMAAWKGPRTGAGGGLERVEGLAEGLADLGARVPEGAGDLADAHAVAVRQTDLGVVFHLQHPCLRRARPFRRSAYCNRGRWGGSILLADPAPQVVLFCAPITSS